MMRGSGRPDQALCLSRKIDLRTEKKGAPAAQGTVWTRVAVLRGHGRRPCPKREGCRERTIGYALALLSLVSSSVQALTLQDRINAAKATIGHWVEDDTGFPYDDTSFSNSGSLGFHAWIDSTKTTWYGIIGRDGSQTGEQLVDDDTTMGWDSVECGRRIRKAWFTGVAQP